MKMTIFDYYGKMLRIKVEAETFKDIEMLYDVGNRIKSPVKTAGVFDSTCVWLLIRIPLRNVYPIWGFNNEINK